MLAIFRFDEFYAMMFNRLVTRPTMILRFWNPFQHTTGIDFLEVFGLFEDHHLLGRLFEERFFLQILLLFALSSVM